MRKMVIVMAVVLAMIMSIGITGCNTKDDISNDVVKLYQKDLDKGHCAGYIEYTRYGFYGPTAYVKSIQTMNYRKSIGEKTSDVYLETVNGETVWYFISIAE